ncbi:unnamed protein product [Pieris brassicae]|uniref:Uncharacterized protein n=1 Tax=Pieris brassicae TaxID=7116 RepID=A0A9P0TZW4_PIEBR|nr:unnamed protein product [Pieris brassicae]
MYKVKNRTAESLRSPDSCYLVSRAALRVERVRRTRTGTARLVRGAAWRSGRGWQPAAYSRARRSDALQCGDSIERLRTIRTAHGREYTGAAVRAIEGGSIRLPVGLCGRLTA